MVRKPIIFALPVAACLLFATDAFADATISAASGSVLVNQGEQFVPSGNGTALHPGDRVLVNTGGSATLTFSDGCESTVAGGTVVTIPSVSPCAGGSMVAQATEPATGGGAAVVTTTGGAGGGSAAVAVLGGLAAAGAAYVIVDNTNDDDNDHPASP
jgi:hypothetical protein